MFIKEIIENKEIRVAIPLTATSGKVRIKRRSILNEYGIPVATCQTELTQNCYIEWQIGYDVVTAEKDKLALTRLKEFKFTGANGKEKALYELSEYVYYLIKFNFIPKSSLSDLKKFLMEMLYLCFPITELKTEPILLGRKAKSKEEAVLLLICVQI